MRLNLKVSTGKKNFCIKQYNDEVLLINIKSNPTQGKANLEIIKEFENIFKQKVWIVKGIKSKNKIIEIDNLDKSELQIILKQN
jgi:uncharacterized protein (TIGR00251 family)